MADRLERVIVSFVVRGAAEVSSASEKARADLKSVEGAGKAAESAAKNADAAAKQAETASRALSSEIASTISRLSQAAALAKKTASALGFAQSSPEGAALDAVGDALALGGQGARLGSIFGPEGTAIGAALGATLGAVSSLREADKRMAEQNHRLEELYRKRQDGELNEALLRAAGLSKLDHVRGP